MPPAPRRRKVGKRGRRGREARRARPLQRLQESRSQRARIANLSPSMTSTPTARTPRTATFTPSPSLLYQGRAGARKSASNLAPQRHRADAAAVRSVAGEAATVRAGVRREVPRSPRPQLRLVSEGEGGEVDWEARALRARDRGARLRGNRRSGARARTMRAFLVMKTGVREESCFFARREGGDREEEGGREGGRERREEGVRDRKIRREGGRVWI